MEFILSIRRKLGLDLAEASPDSEAGLAVANLQTNLENALHNLSEELYTKDTHFVLEFVQNADDNSYADNVRRTSPGPSLEIKLDTKRRVITIYCNEEGFSEANVKAICSVGASTKSRQEGYIGEKGIGFKSVFTIAKVVSVYSGRYSFKFDTSRHLGMIAPIWVPDNAGRRGTTFVLEVLSSINTGELAGKLKELDASLLLFLRKLRHLDIQIDNMAYKFIREDTDRGKIILKSGNKKQTYYVVKNIVDAYCEEIKRPDISTSEIVLAFPLETNGQPLVEQQKVHAFLPLRSYGFSFIIQADFLTTSNREDILGNRPWNVSLRDAISSSFHAAVERFKEIPELHYHWIKYIPLDIPDAFMQPVAAAVKNSVSLLAANGYEYEPGQLVIVPPKYRTSDGNPLVSDSHLDGGGVYLAPGYDTSRDSAILEYLGVRTMSADMFVSALEKMDYQGQLSAQPEAWFERICDILLDLTNDDGFKSRICNLGLIPLDGLGSRVSAGTENVFFRAGLCYVPSDLQLKMVHSSIRDDSVQYRLFWALGVRAADQNRVVDLILEKHNRRSWTLDHSVLFTHARFLFQHAPSTKRLTEVKVLCTDRQIRPAQDVYMDYSRSDIPSDLKPSSLFAQHGAALLDGSYYRSGSARWFDWLHHTLNLNINPRIINYALSPEFSRFASSHAGRFLEALRCYWPHIEHQMSNNSRAIQELSKVSVRCTDGALRPLDSTFIERRALRQFRSLPFLVLPHGDPDDAGWCFLARLGVTFNVDSAFYLKRLKEISGSTVTEHTEDEVAELYVQLSARFNDSNPSAIREAFRDHCLVFVPANSRFALASKSLWMPWEKVCWSGPRSVTQSRVLLSSLDMYRPLKQFFKHQLLCPDCPTDILLEEMKLLTQSLRSKALDDTDHRRVFLVLRSINDMISKRQETGDDLPWLTHLRHLPIFPATMPAGHVALCDLADIYNPRGGFGLAALFKEKVPLLAAPDQCSLEPLQDLLQSEVCRGLKTLVKSVINRVHSSKRRIDAKTSDFYSSRFEFLRRISLSRSGRNSPLVDVCDIAMYQVDELSREQTLESENIVLQSACAAAVLCEEESQAGETRMVLRILRCGEYSRGEMDLEVVQELSRYLNLDPMVISPFLLPQMPPADLEQMMQLEGIGQLAEMALEVDDACLETEDVEFVPGHDVARNTQQGQAVSVLQSSSAKQTRRTRGHPKPARISPGFALEIEIRAIIDELEPNFKFWGLHRFNISDVLSSDSCYLDSQQRDANNDDAADISNLGQSPNFEPNLSSGAGKAGTFERSEHNARSSGTSSNPRMQSDYTTEDYITGILGERFVYELLSRELPNFSESNWTSEMRRHMPHFTPYTGTPLADFVYPDTTGQLTEIIFKGRKRLIEGWRRDGWPIFHLEVKSTATGDKRTPFTLKKQQLMTASRMAIRDLDHPPREVYVLVRVWNVRSQGVLCEAFADPHTMIYLGRLKVVSNDLSFEICI